MTRSGKRGAQMTTMTILGAGAMGSALATPLVGSGWSVRLWGSRYDDELLDVLAAGDPHPFTGVPIPASVLLFRDGELAEALRGSDVVMLSIASVGVGDVLLRALPYLGGTESLLLTSKGLFETEEGLVQLLPDALRGLALERGYDLPPIVAIAGPALAAECASGLPTAAVFACRDLGIAENLARSIRTEGYAIQPSDDEIGVEVCAPMKNVYAIALGLVDGLGEARQMPHRNLRAAVFAQAIKEMSVLGYALGGRPETAFGLTGTGDLEVTSRSGRNTLFGARIGRGQAPNRALDEMKELGQTVEGLPAVSLAVKLIAQSRHRQALEGALPLLGAIHRILMGDTEDVCRQLAEASLPKSA